MTQQPITIRETPNQRYARTTTGRCDPKIEARIQIIRARQTGTDPLRCDARPTVRVRKATDAELADFDARTRRLRGTPDPEQVPIRADPVRVEAA